MKSRLWYWLLVLALFLSSCSVTIQPPTSATSTAPNALPSAGTNTVKSTRVPVSWTDLNLKGRLVYINGSYSGETFSLKIRVLNLVTGEVATIFDAPKYSWIHYLTVSPDAKQLIMSYSPPSEARQTDQQLYSMPLDGSQAPKLLFTPPSPQDAYVEVEWSPNGKYIYFSHANFHIPPQQGQIYPLYEIFRMSYPDGKPEKVAEKAFWPRISSDASHIAYVSVDLFLRDNKLFISDYDGKNAHEVVLQGQQIPEIKDAPIFSPDGKTLIFSAPLPAQAYQPNWFDKFTGVQVAMAHNVPSDWWSVPVEGGAITRLTNIQTTALFASFAPDGRYLVSYSTNGIFVMKPDGSELTTLVENAAAIPGTVTWIP